MSRRAFALEHVARRLAEGRSPGHAAERLGIDRRSFLTSGATAFAAIIAAACDARGPESAQTVLNFAMEQNAKLEGAIFRHPSMDTPSGSAKLAGNKFPAYFVSDTIPVWDEKANGTWALEIGGMVKRPLKLTLQDLVAMKRSEERRVG